MRSARVSGETAALCEMTRFLILFLSAAPGFCQPTPTQVADEMLSTLKKVEWGRAYAAGPKAAGVACAPRNPVQMDVYATVEWTHHCQEVRGGLIRESFYYVFDEPIRTANLRIDLHPQDESPKFTSGLFGVLRARLTERFGAPTHAPQLMEIGFRRTRFGEPVAGDHWQGGELHYFLHTNQSNPSPAGMRRGVQLVVLHDRLMKERIKDDVILQAEGSAFLPLDGDPLQTRLAASAGPAFVKAMQIQTRTREESQQAARELLKTTLDLLREAFAQPAEEKALRLLAGDALVAKLADHLAEIPGGAERDAELSKSARTSLSTYGVKLGGMTHYGGLAYSRDLLRRVWNEFPDTEAGELAFLALQRRGWSTDPGVGCPTNPDLFRNVIAQGEAFLVQHPQARFQKEILFTLAIANESWWSIAHAGPDDQWVAHIPYPRKGENAKLSEKARKRAIDYYTQIVKLAPDSPEAASAMRRLPRIELSLDTGQRRFFCSYC